MSLSAAIFYTCSTLNQVNEYLKNTPTQTAISSNKHYKIKVLSHSTTVSWNTQFGHQSGSYECVNYVSDGVKNIRWMDERGANV